MPVLFFILKRLFGIPCGNASLPSFFPDRAMGPAFQVVVESPFLYFKNMKNIFRSKFSPIGMVLDIAAADGKRRIFYAFQTLVMLVISLLSAWGLRELFAHTLEENFLLFIIGAALCVIVLLVIALPVVIASLMLFFTTLVCSFKGDEKGKNFFAFLVVLVAIVLTTVFLFLIFAGGV